MRHSTSATTGLSDSNNNSSLMYNATMTDAAALSRRSLKQVLEKKS
jgi:hypothetical protein